MKNRINVGDAVDYHSVIGREVTSTGHTVLALHPMPNNFGCDCATIAGKAGVVAVAALTITKQKPRTVVFGCQYPGCRNQSSHRLRGRESTDWTSFCYQHASEAYDRDPLLETEEIESANIEVSHDRTPQTSTPAHG